MTITRQYVKPDVIIQYNIKRAGVIPYTILNNKLYFLLAVDKKTGELTDFGGGCRNSELFLDTALRELHEESCNIFLDTITRQTLAQSVATVNYHKTSIIYFQYINNIWLADAKDLFDSNYSLADNKDLIENIDIKWLTETEFSKYGFCKKYPIVWKRLQNFLISSTSFIKLKFLLLLVLELKKKVCDKSAYIDQYNVTSTDTCKNIVNKLYTDFLNM